MFVCIPYDNINEIKGMIISDKIDANDEYLFIIAIESQQKIKIMPKI
jgi:hypothetical protein